MDNNRGNSNNKNGSKKPRSNLLITIIITVAIVLIISSVYNAVINSQYTQTTYSDFLEAKQSGQLKEVELRYDRDGRDVRLRIDLTGGEPG